MIPVAAMAWWRAPAMMGGKSTGISIPTMATWTTSAVVLDVKGEIRETMWRYRAEMLGHTVYWICPTPPVKRSLAPKGDRSHIDTFSFDILAFISEDPRMVLSDCTEAAKFLCVENPKMENFFNDIGQRCILGVLAYLMRRWISHGRAKGLPRPTMMELCDFLLGNGNDVRARFTAAVAEVIADARDMTLGEADRDLAGGIAKSLGEFTGEAEGEDEVFKKTTSTINKALAWMADPGLARIVSGRTPYSFEAKEILNNKTDVFINFSTTEAESKSQALQAIVGALATVLVKAGDKNEAHEAGGVLFLLPGD
jgi:type IV secretory pathway TraG/TraD family ATPase VirD4